MGTGLSGWHGGKQPVVVFLGHYHKERKGRLAKSEP
jgi:hypothetical protein